MPLLCDCQTPSMAGMEADTIAVAARAGSAPDADKLLRLVGMDELMRVSSGNPQTVVAMIDGPVNSYHPDLVSKNMHTVSGFAGDACVDAESHACMHGTYIAGILHGKRGSFTPALCPDCTLLVRPIFSDGGAVSRADQAPHASARELSAAIVEVMERGARVINLSVGILDPIAGSQSPLEAALAEAARRGVLVVAAAGNTGTVGSTIITRHPWVIPVVACDDDGRALAVSNVGASIGRNGLRAPGQSVRSLKASGGHTTLSGSSVAAPFVAGAGALLWSIFPDASPAQVRAALTAGVASRHRSLIPPLLDARAAYRVLAGGRSANRTRAYA